MTRTVLPDAAMSWAMFIAAVDLPSPGIDETTPMTRMPPSFGAKSMASFTDRSVSANRDSGAFTTCWNTPRSRGEHAPGGSVLVPPRSGRAARLAARQFRQDTQAGEAKDALDLPRRAERPVGKLASERQHQAERQAGDTRKSERDRRLRSGFFPRGRGRGEHASVGNRERLLLKGRFVPVEEAFIEILVGLGVPFQFAQANTRLRDVRGTGGVGRDRLR